MKRQQQEQWAEVVINTEDRNLLAKFYVQSHDSNIYKETEQNKIARFVEL